MSTLVITADDYGYRPAYDRGILEAARAGAVDAVSAMVGRESCVAGPLLETGVEVGLHLELPEGCDRDGAPESVLDQLERFERAFGRPAAYLDGHHHCHATGGRGAAVARLAAERRLPVRSVSPRHRRLLRCLGVATADRTLGRLRPSSPGLPAELEAALAGQAAPEGVTEWFVHPGYAERAEPSSFDSEREDDLRLVLELDRRLRAAFTRATHAAALGS